MLYIALAFEVMAALAGCDPSKKSTGPSDGIAAAKVAASYANEKCKKQWQKEPFYPDLYVAEFRKGRWHWGHYDPAGPGGFSAEVSFERNGSDPKIRVYWSTDEILDLDQDKEDVEVDGPAEDFDS